MIKHIQKTGLLGAILLLSSTTTNAALKPTPKTAGHQDYIFIENNIDKEYFLASYRRDPRFSGSNVWNKHRRKQDSLGYMGTAQSVVKGSFNDVWMENGTFIKPYQGIRCRINNSSCPSTGYLPAQLVNNKGAFKIVAGSSSATGGVARGSFASGAYEYFRKVSVGTTEDIYMHFCTTRENYNPQAGQFCKDMNKGNYWVFGFNLSKMGHVQLLDTKAFQEVWYGTDGTPYLNPNGQYCEYAVVGRDEGVSCKMLKYNVKGDPTKFDISFIMYLITDNASFGFSPLARDLQINGGNGKWYNYNASTRLNSMLTSGDNYISIFFNKTFFKKLAEKKVNIRNIDNLFTFAVDNTELPQSGFYQFSVSTKVELIPREYSLSIQPKGLPEGATPVKSGTIGDSKPITFEYIVKQSAPRQADTIEAYVNAASVMKNGESYCSFKSADKKTEVAIPAWLSMQNTANQEVKQYSGCNINKRLNMKNARWSAEPWDSFGSGYFYRTDLKLVFPMDDPVSEKSIAGLDWMGKVREEGEVKVEAKWLGVTFP